MSSRLDDLAKLTPDSEWKKHKDALRKLILQYRTVPTGDLTQASYRLDKIIQYVAYMCKLGVQPPERKEITERPHPNE